MTSVPMLRTQTTVGGHVWIVDAWPPEATLPPGVVYIAQRPEGGALVATETPSSAALAGLAARPWPLQVYNDSSEAAPFAVLGDDGRYAQLETFGLEHAVAETGEPIHKCTFLCGDTTGELRLCAD